MDYFRIVDDMEVQEKWHLGEPLDSCGVELDARLFTEGRSVVVEGDGLVVPRRRDGRELQFTLAAFDMPVIHSSVAAVVKRVAGQSVECIPARVEGSQELYYVMNVVRVIDCMDAGKSQIERWTAAHGRPEKVGEPRTVGRLRINPSRAMDEPIFRLQGWLVALVVSDQLRKGLLEVGASGIVFQAIT